MHPEKPPIICALQINNFEVLMEIHIFDVDHTLVKRSTGRCFIRTGVKNRLISLPQLIKVPIQFILYKTGIIDPEFIEQEIRSFRNISKALLRKLSRETFEQLVRKELYTEGLILIEKLKQQGHRIIIATSSLDLLIEPILEYLNITEYVATRLEYKDGKTTGRTRGDAVFGENKKKAVEEYFREQNISLNEATFYSDSYNDLPLLSACGKAVVVNPDNKLKKEARKKKWMFLSFKETLG